MKAFVSFLSLVGILASSWVAGTQQQLAGQTFENFESPLAHPLAVAHDGSQLFAINTPARQLEIYSLNNPAAPVLVRQIPVGLEPISLVVHTPREAWVVNHLSDSVSVVDLVAGAVTKTLQVGDSPGDIVFAGNPPRAFVSSMTERKVDVLDPRTYELVATIPIHGNDPRTMLASADGTTVWVAIFRSGNGTTVVPHSQAPTPPQPSRRELPPAPPQGIIVRSDDPAWRKQLNLSLPDHDVFEIDVATLSVRRAFEEVGTILFNLAQHPVNGELWIANTDARNLVRFETALRGHVIDSQVTRLEATKDQQRARIDLNPEIDYQQLPNEKARTLALSQPTDIVFRRSGEVAFVATMGTDRIAVLGANGEILDRIEIGDVSGPGTSPRNKRGPRALALHPDGDQLYILNRLSNSITVVDTSERSVVAEIPMADPTPEVVRQGRGYLFDARLSGNGTVACASCHVDGDLDGLAWDLGNPAGTMFSNGSARRLHPMKGPLLTQTLRGLAGERLFHWRGDRPGLEAFNGTFESLLGGRLLPDEDLELLVAYMKSIRFAPNRFRNADGSFPDTPQGESARAGRDVFLTKAGVGKEGHGLFRCVDCHLNSNGSGGFGFTGLIQQPTKAAQLRGLSARDGLESTPDGRLAGFGYGADGSKESLTSFLEDAHRFTGLDDEQRESLAQFLRMFPTETPAVIGLTRTVTRSTRDDKQIRSDLDLMIQQAQLEKCGISVSGVLAGQQVSFSYQVNQRVFLPHDEKDNPLELAALLSSLRQPASVLSFVAIPLGEGGKIRR